MKTNKISKQTKLFSLALFGLVFFLPKVSFGATISASSMSSVSAGDTTIIDVYLDTEGQVVNTIDGFVSLSYGQDDNFEIKEISLANSSFTIWPRKPSLESGHKIYFVGGIPGGLNTDRALLFKIIAKLNSPGDFTIKPENLTAYLNDGLGTAIKITKDSSVVKISSANGEPKDSWKEIVSNDNVPPARFEVKIIKDENLFDGRKFAYFETTDDGSGIDRYEVREGNGPSVRSGTSYVLINQEKDLDLVVTAYDKAGNYQIATLKNKQPINWAGILVSVALVLVLTSIIKKVLKIVRRKNA